MTKKLRNHEKIFYYFLLIPISFVLIAPFLYMISISLASHETTIKGVFSLIPKEYHFKNYLEVFNDARLLIWSRNSLIIVTACIIGQVFTSSLVAYGFARIRNKHKNILFVVLLMTMMLPSQVTMLPTFVIFSNIGWYNTYLPLIVPSFFGGAFNIFLLRQFISRIPNTLDEAGKMDGLFHFGIYWYLILPQIKPAAIIVAIFTFNGVWGDYFGPLLYIKDVTKTTLAYGIKILSATSSMGEVKPWNIVMVASMLLTIPMLAVYYFGQDKIYTDLGSAIGGNDK